MKPIDFMIAARATHIPIQTRGLWSIERRTANPLLAGWPEYTLLRRWTDATIHLPVPTPEVVMEDSRAELARHLPIWLQAEGNVLVTGLGLGCVVRGLLASQRVTHIEVVEIDPVIVGMVGPSFAREPRVEILNADALAVRWTRGKRWDFGWHDLWSADGHSHLQTLHARLIHKYAPHCKRQGAWMLPRFVKRKIPGIIG